MSSASGLWTPQPPGRALDCQELEAVAQDAWRSGAWQEHVVSDAAERQYAALHRSEFLEVWALFWMAGQETGMHDHGAARVGIHVGSGALRERHVSPGGFTHIRP